MASLLLRGIPLLRLRLGTRLLAPQRQSICSTTTYEPTQPDENVISEDKTGSTVSSMKDPPVYNRWNDPDYRKWKDKEKEILRDIQPIMFLTKEIIHSDRYMDGERLTAEDEGFVVEKLLAYHPHSEDKIGCGLDSIMVDRHPQYRNTRCLFVVRTDGGWTDFSYRKCLRAYIQDKYPSYAEGFIQEHLKRGSG
ncbi:protein DCL homolog, chloroplastic-like [Mangifera indica]|uniref:protein DCL homolog, chloroplastic-like n=1 Tax=Mangifera indica TaxID=29780 RepID=UPI001CFB268C|nr:protein DCL homolog, chloroplastic-like [Mangifera indica]